MAGYFLMGEVAQVPHYPEGWPFRVAISAAPDPQGSSRVDMLTHLYTTAACAVVVVTVTAGRDSSRCHCHGSRSVCRLALDSEYVF